MPQDLLDLPPELFQRVVHELVLDVGIVEAWKLRSVSRTFAAEIHHDIFAHQPKEVFIAYLNRTSPGCPLPRNNGEILKNNLPLYLRNRMNARLDADGVLVPKLKELLDYLMKELGVQDFEQRQQHAIQLTEGIILGNSGRWAAWVKTFLWDCEPMHNYFTDSANKIKGRAATAAEKLCAAVAVNAYNLVTPLFAEAKDAARTHFGDPLTIATRRGDTKMVRTLLDCYSKFYPGKHTHQDKLDAIEEAIKVNNADALKLLIYSCRPWDQIHSSENVMHKMWMNEAAMTGSVATLDAVIETKGGRKGMLNQEAVKSICGHGTVAVINHYIGIGLLDVNKTYSHTSPLVAATEEAYHEGSIDRVATLISAGADVNKATGNGTTALCVAAKRNRRYTMGYLLDKGANTNTDNWPPYHHNVAKCRLQYVLEDRAATPLSTT
ncbi:hypothetical protein P171DRAFT_440257 [Karstenula rhodostoma CBS 690.94]|uniref:Ankyrin n=1 Tax=Karstenula rhodostoma CBS 690.94 TaxID=1392251 RepID=A0A9P4PT73_9PLEO|nr:hypothetical protein P171DRAFT_440257 [Karstenula rhodostoma CBS 690.94]